MLARDYFIGMHEVNPYYLENVIRIAFRKKNQRCKYSIFSITVETYFDFVPI